MSTIVNYEMVSSEHFRSLDEVDTQALKSLSSVAIDKGEVVEIVAQNEVCIVITTQHNSIYVDPDSNCNGTVAATIKKTQRGSVEATCNGCSQLVNIAASQVLIATGELRSRIINPLTPKETKDLSLMSGICEETIQAWGSVFGDRERLINYLRHRQQD